MDTLLKSRIFYSLITGLLYNRFFNRHLLKLIEKRAVSYLSPGKGTEYTSQSKKMQDEKKIMVSAIIQTIKRSISSKAIGKGITLETIRLWTKAVIPGKLFNPEVSRFVKENQSKPPWFLVISPGKSCNLSCNDCYAGSAPGGRGALIGASTTFEARSSAESRPGQRTLPPYLPQGSDP